MHDQLSMFSEGLEFIEKAEEALENLDAGKAESFLMTARSINPWMARLESLEKSVQLMKISLKKENQKGPLLALMWKTVPRWVSERTLTTAEGLWADSIISRAAIKTKKQDDFFVDEKNELHLGSCLLSLNEPGKAHRLLLQTVSHPFLIRGDLWGYYGDACFLLGRIKEANAAYFLALVLDPFSVDVFRLKSQPLLCLYAKLAMRYGEPDAKSLLLLFGYSQGIINAHPVQSDSNPLWKRIKSMAFSNHIPRLHRFCLLSLLDQDRDADPEIRLTMKALDAGLFSTYLKRVSAQGKNEELWD